MCRWYEASASAEEIEKICFVHITLLLIPIYEGFLYPVPTCEGVCVCVCVCVYVFHGGGAFSHQAVLRWQQGVWEFSPILTLSTWWRAQSCKTLHFWHQAQAQVVTWASEWLQTGGSCDLLLRFDSFPRMAHRTHFSVFSFLATPRSLWDLSSPTRDRTWALAAKAPSPDHWTAREFLNTRICVDWMWGKQ